MKYGTKPQRTINCVFRSFGPPMIIVAAGLAAIAASAIVKGDPIKNGIQGFTYHIRTALLPFLFIFNTELLLIDVA